MVRKRPPIAHLRILTDDQVREARRRYEAGEQIASIARDFGVKHDVVNYAARRATYRDVPDEESEGTNE